MNMLEVLCWMAEYFSSAVERLWLMSLQSCVLIVIVLMARQILKKYPRVFCYSLWAVVGLRLLCPVLLESPWSLWPDSGKFFAAFYETEEEKEQNNLSETVTDASGQVSGDFSEHPDNAELRTDLENSSKLPENKEKTEENFTEASMQETSVKNEETVLNGLQEQQTEPLIESSFSWQVLAVLVYLSGVVLFAGWCLIRYYFMCRKLRTAVRKNGNIWMCDRVQSPFVIGILCPKIILPYGLSEKEEYYIVQHESVHIQHFDSVVRLLSMVCLCIHWWNPFVWLAVYKANQDMEMFCDETVLSEAEAAKRKDYAEVLLNFAVHQSSISFDLAFGKSNTELRIRNILGKKKKNRLVIGVVVTVAVLCSVACFMQPEKKPETGFPDENVPLTPAPEQTLEKTPLTPALEQTSEKRVQVFTKNEVLATNPVPAYTLNQLQTIGTVRTIQGVLPGAAFGTWYMAEWQGIEYYFGCPEGEDDKQAKLYSYAIFSKEYPLANGIQVGMTKEEVLALYPEMTEVLIAEETGYLESESSAFGFDTSCYPRSYSGNDEILDYLDKKVLYWHDRFDGCLLAKIDGETKDGRTMALALMLKNNQVEAVTFYCQNDGCVTPEDWAAVISAPWNGAFVQLPEVLELPQVSAKTQEETEIKQKISKQYQAILYDYLPVLNQSFAICDVDLDGREELILHLAGPSDEMPEGYFNGVQIIECSLETEQWTQGFFPSSAVQLKFLENGMVAAAQSHNHSYAYQYGRELWPYTLYQYEAETDTYECVTEVKAWDKYCYGDGFPEAVDADGDGLVYCFSADGIWQDGAAYEAWFTETFTGVKAYKIPFQSLSMEAIEAVASEEP